MAKKLRCNYTVYMHVCPNGKKYIGITKQKLEKRWQKGYGYITQSFFSKAIKKYGWDNIEHKVLYKNLTKKEACQQEINLIKKYKTNNCQYGYNISSGGEGVHGVIISKKQRDLLKKILKGNQHAKGYKHTDEEKKKMRLAKLGKPNLKLSKKVLCLETNIIYSSVAEAKRQTGINCIDRACRGVFEYAGKINNQKIHWKYI